MQVVGTGGRGGGKGGHLVTDDGGREGGRGGGGTGGGIKVFVLLMCSAGSDKGLVGANQLLSGSSSQMSVCFLGVAVDQSLRFCMSVCVGHKDGEW